MRLLFAVLMFMLGVFPARGETLKVSKFSEIQGIYKDVLKKTKGEEILGLWDINMTLLHFESPALHMVNLKKHYGAFKEMLKDLSPEEIDKVFSYALISSEQRLMEPEVPSILEGLQKKGVRQIALTGILTGELDGIQLETFQRNSLKTHGINFSHNFPNLLEITFKGFPSYRGFHPVYLKGVLSINGERNPEGGKGKVLVAFLKMVAFRPKVIIFTDDREKNLKIVEDALKAFDPSIQFVGIHYTGASKVPGKPLSAKAFKDHWGTYIEKAQEKNEAA